MSTIAKHIEVYQARQSPSRYALELSAFSEVTSHFREQDSSGKTKEPLLPTESFLSDPSAGLIADDFEFVVLSR